jgi:glyoxylate reductase
MKPRVFVSRNIPDKGLDLVKEKVSLEVWPGEDSPGREVFLEKAAVCDGLIVIPGDPIDRGVLAAGKSLKIVSCYAVGYDSIDVSAATELGIMVTNTPDVLTETTADLAFGLLLAAARRIGEGDRTIRSGGWKHWGPQFMLGRDVSGATLGMIGMGRIGQAVCRRAKSFGMNLLYFARHRNEIAEGEYGARYMEMEALLAVSDFVSLHCPLTPSTEGLIGERQLRAMQSSSILINTSRGRVIVEEELVRALQEGWISGAGLDVFEKEPLPPGHPFLGMENVVLCPHLGSATVQTREKMSVMAAESLIAALEGHTPRFLVNPAVCRKA